MSPIRFGRTVGLLGVAYAAAMASPASAQNTAVIPAVFQEERHAGFLEEAGRGGIECLLMGDSITDWWRRAGLEVYEENFGPLDCANFGIAGDRTQGVIWRMEHGELEVDAQRRCAPEGRRIVGQQQCRAGGIAAGERGAKILAAIRSQQVAAVVVDPDQVENGFAAANLAPLVAEHAHPQRFRVCRKL